MTVTCNKILLAISHSFNLIIYCLSSKSFRTNVKNVCASLAGSDLEQRTVSPAHDAFFTAADCILHVQELMVQEQERTLSMARRRDSVTHIVLKDGTSFLMRRQGTPDHPLAYLDLAVPCNFKHDYRTQNFLANKRSLRFQKMLDTKNNFDVFSCSRTSLY